MIEQLQNDIIKNLHYKLRNRLLDNPSPACVVLCDFSALMQQLQCTLIRRHLHQGPPGQ